MTEGIDLLPVIDDDGHELRITTPGTGAEAVGKQQTTREDISGQWRRRQQLLLPRLSSWSAVSETTIVLSSLCDTHTGCTANQKGTSLPPTHSPDVVNENGFYNVVSA